MPFIAQQPALANIVGTLLFLAFPGYLEYRAIQELRGQLFTTSQTRRVCGHILWAIGLVLFFAILILLVVISLLGVRDWSLAGPFISIAIALILLGMFLGNQQIGKLRKKRLARTITDGRPNQ
jgi:hypothetical protein